MNKLPADLFHEGEVAGADGLRLRYYRTGGAKPPVVLLHGWTNSARCWSELAAVLAPEFDVIAYDARGHGQSDRLPAGAPLAVPPLAHDLGRVVAELGLRRPGLIGHSMGAGTIAWALARQPDLAGFVVLEDPPWFASAEVRATHTQDWGAWNNWALTAPQKPWDTAMAEYRALCSPKWSALTLELRLEAIRQLDPRALTDVDWTWRAWQVDTPGLRCPWLLVTGDTVACDGIVTPETAQAAVRATPAGEWVQIPDAGHNVRYENPAAFTAAVRAFVQRQLS